MDEFRLIHELFVPLSASCPGALGLTDDVAFLSPLPGHDMVVTCDAVVAGIHFLPDDPPDLIARKAIRVNLSDLAAKGAEPTGLLLALAIPHGADEEMIRRLAAGLAADVAEYEVPLIGGDTVATHGPMMLSITALGQVPAGTRITRGNARAGELVFVSGTIGDGALGLLCATGKLKLQDEHHTFLIDRYRLPRPRIALGRRLHGLARAGMDVSDGLVQDAGHICEVSSVSIRMDVERLPLSDAARAALANDSTLLASVLGGGDDYELLFTAPPECRDAIARAAERSGIAVTEIGRVEPGRGVKVHRQERLLDVGQGGYRHFSEAGGQGQ